MWKWTSAKAYGAYLCCVYLFFGVYLPFLPGWLDYRGFSETSIGALTGVAFVLRLVLAPPIAYRAEQMKDPRRGLSLVTFAMVVALWALMVPFPNVVAGVFVMVAWIFFGLVVPMGDSALRRADQRDELNFGIVRGLASASFILAAIGGGWVISRFGDQVVVFWCALTILGAWVATLLLPAEPTVRTDRSARPSVRSAFELFRSTSFLLMLGASGLVQGAHAVYYAFTELHWSALGYTSATIGWLWAFGVFCEVLLLFVARPLTRRVGAPVLLLIGAAAALIRWPLTGLSPPLVALFGLQALHALTFAITYLGAIEFIDRAVPQAYRTTAMTLKSNIGAGGVLGIATVLVGLQFNRFAPFPSYAAMGGMGALGLVLAIWLLRRWDGGLLKAVAQAGCDTQTR